MCASTFCLCTALGQPSSLFLRCGMDVPCHTGSWVPLVAACTPVPVRQSSVLFDSMAAAGCSCGGETMGWWQMWTIPYSCLSLSEQVATVGSMPAGSLHTAMPFSKRFISEPVSVPVHTMAKKFLYIPLFHCASQTSSVPDVPRREMHQALA